MRNLYSCQHCFRAGNACETAPHQIISRGFANLDNKWISLLLFVNFKKILIWLIPSSYSLNYSATVLAKAQWNLRQVARLGSLISPSSSINLGVPQGSVY